MNLIDKLVARREALQSEDGFSFLEMVIAGVLLGALAAGGVVGYGKVVQNGHNQAFKGAVSQLTTAGTVALNDNDDATTLATVVSDFDTSKTGGITATVEGNTIVIHSKSAKEGASEANTATVDFDNNAKVTYTKA